MKTTDRDKPPSFKNAFTEVLKNALLDELDATVELGNVSTEFSSQILQVIETLKTLELSGLYCFFSSNAMVRFGTQVAHDPVVLKFVVSLADRVQIGLRLSDKLDLSEEKKDLESLTESLVVMLEKRVQANSLIPKDVQASIILDTAAIRNILTANDWLVVVYLCLATGAFSDVLAELNFDNVGSA